MTVAVVGAGAAGVATCQALRGGGYAGSITLIGAEPDLPYDRPPLSKKVLAGTASPETATLHPATWYADHHIDLRLGTPAEELRPDGVALADGTVIAASTVVLATGGRPRRLTVPGADHPAIRHLRTRADAIALRDALAPGLHLLVVGGGLIGAEAASVAVARGTRVTLVEPDPCPLARVVGAPVAAFLHGEHAAHGVRVETAQVTGFRPDGNGVVATLGDGREVAADGVLIGIGIEPETRLAARAGLAVDDGVLVGPEQRAGTGAVFAVGDAARQVGRPRVEHWHGAHQSAARAAAAILGVSAPVTAPWFWSDRYGTHLEMAGVADPGATMIVRGMLGDPAGFSVFYHRDRSVLGAVTVNRPLDCRAAQRLIDRAVAVDEGALKDETVALKRLLR
ncbi:NADPH-dependent 2,4-dienoyl-CoA reductase/sulfur reductase-like enzyme [Allocatelliglobosispora scoriae]|uniref:NADPH-dependent 2,4-dienoyl-CoA reductase/sulfur reductase-like enzyme n=1 Tax=Allocatelliglobosispora scoriae TaxID=643052 RepID=A0A841BQB9_9ACTN|nr:FAD-dependent oxidoreductase [Allocatelliglobosispora scoriae]MBB5868952.1 NADPH-dependent 2,4-dienoyl-CoA reductase/sulfur reductase-like enzyme [Allocatelliglobosispora scoriae]